MRSQSFMVFNPSTKQFEQTIKPYYQRTIYSTQALATSSPLSAFAPFSNAEAATLRNYNKGQNIFEMNQGQVLAIQGDIFTASYKAFLPITGVATQAVLDEYAQLITQHELHIRQDGQISHKATFDEIFPEVPWWLQATTSGTPALFSNGNGGSNNLESIRRGVYFVPPLFVGNGRSLDFTISTPSSFVPTAALNGLLLRWKMVIVEIQPDNPSPVQK